MPISDIKTGQILLVSSHSDLAKAIQLFQDCKWNHAGVMMVIDGVNYVVEALEHGIALTDFNEYIKSDKGLLMCVPNFKIDEENAQKFLMKYPGNYPYGFFNLVFLQPVKYIFHKWIGRQIIKNPKRFICGQFAAYFINNMNKDVFKTWEPVAPVDIYNDINFTHILIK